MNEAYTLVETATGFPIDVIDCLTVAIGVQARFERNNDDIETHLRIATPEEHRNAHIIQTDAMREFCPWN